MNFGSGYIDAALVAANFFAARYMKLRLFAVPTLVRATSYLASFTFVLYLTHRPLMRLFVFAFSYNPHDVLDVARLVGSVLLCVYLLGFLTEKRKTDWRSFFSRVLEWMASTAKVYAPTAYRLLRPTA